MSNFVKYTPANHVLEQTFPNKTRIHISLGGKDKATQNTSDFFNVRRNLWTVEKPFKKRLSTLTYVKNVNNDNGQKKLLGIIMTDPIMRETNQTKSEIRKYELPAIKLDIENYINFCLKNQYDRDSIKPKGLVTRPLQTTIIIHNFSKYGQAYRVENDQYFEVTFYFCKTLWCPTINNFREQGSV